MKFQHNPKYTTIAIYALIVLTLAMVCQYALENLGMVMGFLGKVTGFIVPVIYGVVFAFLLNPLLRTMESRLLPRIGGDQLKPTVRRGVAMILTYLIALICLAVFISIVLPQLLQSLFSILANVPSYIRSITTLYNDISIWLNNMLISNAGMDALGIAEGFSSQIRTTITSMLGALYDLLERSIGAMVTLTTNLTTGVINLILGVIISIYILTDREKLFAQLKKICCALFPKPFYHLLYDIALDVNRIVSGFVIGKVIDSLIIGILCVIGMSILGFPYAVLISVIVGVTNVIPYFGPIIGAIPGFIIIFIVNPVQSVWFLLFVLLLQQLDGNVIGPKILGDTIGLSPLWIIFSIMLFSGLMGVLGMFIGVPLFAIIYSLVKRLAAYLLNRKGESTNTRDYATDSNPLIK